MKDQIYLITIKDAKVKQIKVSKRYYLHLKLSYGNDPERIFYDSIAFGNYKDFVEDQDKGNMIWDMAKDRLKQMQVPLNCCETPKALIGHTFKGVIEHKYYPTMKTHRTILAKIISED